MISNDNNVEPAVVYTLVHRAYIQGARTGALATGILTILLMWWGVI
jgi:hypothetical protein